MNNIWTVLGIDPTEDLSEIKKAYARQSRSYNPEDDPQGFMKLREAYQAALAYVQDQTETSVFAPAESSAMPQTPHFQEISQELQDKTAISTVPQSSTPQQESEQSFESSDVQEVTFTFAEDFSTADSYRNTAVFQTFSKLYQKQNMKNWKLWMEYFVSSDFLEVRSQEGFCALLKEHILSQLDSIRPASAFLKVLHVVYCTQRVSWNQSKPVYRSFSSQNPPASMLELIQQLPDCSHFSGEDQVMFYAFMDYDQLIAIQQNGWDDDGFAALAKILRAYVMAYIKDKVPPVSFADPKAADNARHPLGLRLLTYFFATASLPLEVYQILWTTLDLKNAKMGRADVLYGGLRALCLEHSPALQEYEPQRFAALKTAFMEYWQNVQVDPQIILLFDREDMNAALQDREFIEHEVLNHWISPRMGDEFLLQLKSFYLNHSQAPFAARICHKCDQAMEGQKRVMRNKEDELDNAQIAPHTLCHRPFLRYWLHVAFPRFDKFNTIVQNSLPLLPSWRSQLFLSSDKEGEPVQAIQVQWKNIPVQVMLHQFYLEYRYQGEELIFPCCKLQDLTALGEAGIWLLPLAVVQPGEEMQTEKWVTEMLSATAFPTEDLAEAASALTKDLYQWNLENEIPSALTFQETAMDLYGAEISTVYCDAKIPIQTIQLFRCIDENLHYLPDRYEILPQQENALLKAHQLLHDLIQPPLLCYAPQGEHHDRRLPNRVYYRPVHDTEECWEPSIEILNRLWGTLNFWQEMRCIAQNTQERVEAIERRWNVWAQQGGCQESLLSQLQALTSYFDEAELPLPLYDVCLKDPQGPLALLDRLQTFVLHANKTTEKDLLKTLLEFAGWNDDETSNDLEELAPVIAVFDAKSTQAADSLHKPITQKEYQNVQHLQEQQKIFLEAAAQKKAHIKPDTMTLEQMRITFLKKMEPLLDWLFRQVDQLRELYLKDLDQLLEAFADGELERLELVMEPLPEELPQREEAYPPVYSLVFQRSTKGISCLYFDDLNNIFYALRWDDKRPGTNAELFVNLAQDHPLPKCCLFASFFPFRCCLQEILDILLMHFQPTAEPENMGNMFWMKAWGGSYVGNPRNKYNLAKQELGHFPMERAALPSSQDICLPAFVTVKQGIQAAPDFELTIWDINGCKEPPVLVQRSRLAVFSKAIKQFFDQELSRLRLSWEVSPSNYLEHCGPKFYEKHLTELAGKKAFCHLVLSRDGDKMMLLLMEDFTSRALYYVADQLTYMDVDRKYPKGTFAGKTVPAYLIHTDPAPLRSQLELLLDHLTCPYEITTRFAEYADEKPVKARAYSAIQEEVLNL